MKCLIVTADDFGLSKSINEGIVKAYKDGIVTSISLIPTGEAFHDAVALARDLKLEDIGAHLSLTETGPLTHFNITAFSKITGFTPKEIWMISLRAEWRIRF